MNKKQEQTENSWLSSLVLKVIAVLESVVSRGAIKVTNTVNTPAPKEFEIGENFEDWIKQANTYLEQFPIGQRRTFMRGLFRGKALEMINQSGLLDKEIDEEILIEKMSELLSTKMSMYKARRLLKDRYQGRYETTAEYILDVMKLGQLAFPEETQRTQNNLSLAQITEGARCPEVRKEFRKNVPKDEFKAIKMAREIEDSEDVYFATRQRTGQMSSRGNNSYQQSGQKDCYYCQKFGKLAKKCKHND